MKKQFKQPKYLVQIDTKYCTKDVTNIWNYEFSYIKDVEYITYHSYRYSYKMKDDIMMEFFERFGEFDKIFDDEDDVYEYLNSFNKTFKEYYVNLNYRINMLNLLQKRHNIENGLSDVRIFNKSVDDWRYS